MCHGSCFLNWVCVSVGYIHSPAQAWSIWLATILYSLGPVTVVETVRSLARGDESPVDKILALLLAMFKVA